MKTKKKIEAIAITAIAFITIFALIGTASATLANLSVGGAGAGVHLYGQDVTVTWESSSSGLSYIWIAAGNQADLTNITPCNDPVNYMVNNISSVNPSRVAGTVISGLSVEYSSHIGGATPYKFSYTFANWTVNLTQYKWMVYVNDTGQNTFPDVTGLSAADNTTDFTMTAYNITFPFYRSCGYPNSTIAGDNITIYVNTSAIGAGQGATTRDNLPLSMAIPAAEGGNTMWDTSLVPGHNVAGSGNYTFLINTTTAGVGWFRNITLSYGSPANFTWNSTQLATNAGLWGGTQTWMQFNVSKVNLMAYDLPYYSTDTGTSYNITSVNITTLDHSGNLQPAHPAYEVNITLTNSLTSISFNDSYAGRWASHVYKANVTFAAGNGHYSCVGGTLAYGNYTHPLNTSGVITSAGTHTITASTNTSGMAWTDDYVIHATTVYNKINEPAAGASFKVGELINITGWNSTGAAGVVWLNITEPSGTKINVSSVSLNPTDGSFAFTWDTSWTFNDQQAITWDKNATQNKTGSYKLWFGNSTAYDDVITITLAEDITVETNATTMGVDGTLWINGTTDRWNSNATEIGCNITTGADGTGTILNASNKYTITDFNWSTGLASYSILWNSTDDVVYGNLTRTSTIPWDTFSKTYYIKVNDSAAKNTTATITITDSITVEAASGVGGYNFTARGTTTRQNGTLINVSLQTLAGIPLRYVDTTAHNGLWNVSINASSGTNPTEVPLTDIEDYYIIANDSIVKAKNTLVIGTGVLDYEMIPAEATMDDIVWINGTTDLANGTIVNFNITNSAGKVVFINATLTGSDVKTLPVNATVNADGTFNKSWQINASWITGNCTAPLTTLTVNASNGSIVTLKTFTVNETLTITTPDVEIAAGGTFKVEGTLNRNNDTTLQVVTKTTGGVQTSATTATVYSGAWNVTLTATHDLGNLPTGAYTITVKDAASAATSKINASAAIDMTVATGSITLVEPADGSSAELNTTVTISGTTNIGNATRITVTIIRSGFQNASLVATCSPAGAWSTAWNTTADAALHLLATPTGDYQIIAANGSTVSAAHTVTLTPKVTPETLTVTTTTTTVTVNTSTDVTFTVTDAAEAAVGDATVTLSGVVTGSGTTDANGTVTIAVNATSAGNITATASKTGYTSGTTTITASPDWNPYDDDEVITTEEIQILVNYWVTDTPLNGHTITTTEMQEFVYMWLTT